MKEKHRIMPLTTRIKRGFEGYSRSLMTEFQGENYMSFWGAAPTMDKFTFRYSINDGDKQICQTSIDLTNTEALQLEEVMTREKRERSMRSETYHYGSIYMSCIAGGFPVICFTEKGVTLTMMSDDDYNLLFELVKNYNEGQQLKKLKNGSDC